MTTRRKRHRKQVFWVIDKIMADGKQRTAEAIRDEFEQYRSDKGAGEQMFQPATKYEDLLEQKKNMKK